MAPPFYQVIQGQFVIIGKQPDGDSVRFIANNPELYGNLRRDDRIKPSREDKSVQLRFEAVDAPEIHYGRAAQPLGAAARDRLLAWMGFESIQFTSADSDQVKDSDPKVIPGAILSKAVETNGRPVSYVLLAAAAEPLEEDWIRVDKALLRKTLNFRLLAEGVAYYTVYTSTPVEHRQLLRKAALQAQQKSLGVWAEDRTDQFTLVNQDSIGPGGQLILPKLFRRCTDFLKDQSEGGGNLKDWLRSKPRENDQVLLLDSVESLPSVEVQLSDLLRQSNRQIFFQPDLLDLVFVEK